MGGSSVLAFTALQSDLVDGVCSENGMCHYFSRIHWLADALRVLVTRGRQKEEKALRKY